MTDATGGLMERRTVGWGAGGGGFGAHPRPFGRLHFIHTWLGWQGA